MRELRWIPVAGALSLAACAWWMAGRSGVASLDRIIFSHQVHQHNDIECETCHEGIAKAQDLATSHRPEEETCLECHEKEENCGQCHTNVENHRPRRAAEAGISFSHAAHQGPAKESCAPCHSAVAISEQLPVPRPDMDTCLVCHNHREEYSTARCLGCHPNLRRIPLKAVAEFSHTGDWASRHGLMARAQGQACLQCHPETACAECHSRVAAAAPVRLFPEAVERPHIHRGDWISTHAIEARADGDTCLRCHRSPRQCAACHEASGIALGGGRVVHPVGWAMPGGREFHGDAARLRIETCAACHDQGPASNCIQCHRVGGIGGNPHPAGWGGEEHAETTQMCQYCHADAN